MSSYPLFFHLSFQAALTIYATPPLVQISSSARAQKKKKANIMINAIRHAEGTPRTNMKMSTQKDIENRKVLIGNKQ